MSEHTDDVANEIKLQRIDFIERRFHDIERKLDDVIAIAEKVEKIVETIAAEVKPTLDTLMNHPMLKMFLANKKGK